MHSIENLQSLITRKVDGFCRVNGEEPILQPVNYILQLGGKRMRPLLSLMTANLFSDELEDAVYPALALEVFHNFTLMHDDIMDRAPIRRGMPTVHEKWDVNTAILSGDAMLIQAYQLLSKAPAASLHKVLQVFSKTAMEVCRGQYSDMLFEARTDVAIEEYIEMIRLKTSVLLAGAMQIGSVISGANESDQHHVYSFGENLGISFQLWDDYLDAFGDESKVGKQKGGDILADKKTFLLIKAFEMAGAREQKTLDHYIGNNQTNGVEKVNAVLEVFESLQLGELLRSQMAMYFDHAMESLDAVSIDATRKSGLREFASGLMSRQY